MEFVFRVAFNIAGVIATIFCLYQGWTLLFRSIAEETRQSDRASALIGGLFLLACFVALMFNGA
jgi:hypothetical protein